MEVAIALFVHISADGMADRNGSVDRATGSTSIWETILRLISEDGQTDRQTVLFFIYTAMYQNSGSK